MGQPLAPIGHSFAYAQRFISAWAITFAAVVANPLLQRFDSAINVKKSPMTAMGVYAMLGNLALMLSGLVNQNPYRTLRSVMSIPDSVVYIWGGRESGLSQTFDSISGILSCVDPKNNYANLCWPEGLLSAEGQPLSLTSMDCWDCVAGIRTLSEKDPLHPEIDQQAINRAYTKFSEALNRQTSGTKSCLENSKKDFVLFCQAHAPYYSERPFLRAVQSLGDIKRNPLAVAQVLGIFSEIFGVIAGLQTSPRGQTHPLESVNSAITLALRCLVILGSMKEVADTVQTMQAYQPNPSNTTEDPVLWGPFGNLLNNSNKIYAAINLAMDTPTTGVDALWACWGPEHDIFKLLSFLFYSMDLIIRFDLDKDRTPSQAQAGESNVPVRPVTTEAFFEGLNHQNPLEAFSQWLRLMQSENVSARDS